MKNPQPTLSEMHSKEPFYRLGKSRVKITMYELVVFTSQRAIKYNKFAMHHVPFCPQHILLFIYLLSLACARMVDG